VTLPTLPNSAASIIAPLPIDFQRCSNFVINITHPSQAILTATTTVAYGSATIPVVLTRRALR
jgi:hypothetical protein